MLATAIALTVLLYSLLQGHLHRHFITNTCYVLLVLIIFKHGVLWNTTIH